MGMLLCGGLGLELVLEFYSCFIKRIASAEDGVVMNSLFECIFVLIKQSFFFFYEP